MTQPSSSRHVGSCRHIAVGSCCEDHPSLHHHHQCFGCHSCGHTGCLILWLLGAWLFLGQGNPFPLSQPACLPTFTNTVRTVANTPCQPTLHFQTVPLRATSKQLHMCTSRHYAAGCICHNGTANGNTSAPAMPAINSLANSWLGG